LATLITPQSLQASRRFNQEEPLKLFLFFVLFFFFVIEERRTFVGVVVEKFSTHYKTPKI
jgi:hypothetical protein